MKFLNKLERRFGKYVIPNLTRYIILTYIIGYILSAVSEARGIPILYYLAMNPGLILKGQIWRLVSWILMPPTSFSIWTVVMLFCYYQLGTVLERTWGDFLYNFYIFFGVLMTIIGAFVACLIIGTDPGEFFKSGAGNISTYYISLSIFLGFAMTFPDQQMLFMFIIPIKIKYLAILDIVYLIYSIVQTNFNPAVIIMIVCSLASTILFFFMSRNYSRWNPSQRRRRKAFEDAMRGPYAQGGSSGGWTAGGFGARGGGRNASAGSGSKVTPITKHRCTICGRTELDDPDLEFRFCSKCSGNYEYCTDHLKNHQHIVP